MPQTLEDAFKTSGRKPALILTPDRKRVLPYLRLLQGVGIGRQEGVSDTPGTRWDPRTPGERLAVWQLVWRRRIRCGNPHCRCATSPEARHGPYLSVRVPTQEGKRHQVYIPVEQAAEVARAVRQAKGVRKRRLRRDRLKAQRDHERFRWAKAVLNAAYGRPR